MNAISDTRYSHVISDTCNQGYM